MKPSHWDAWKRLLFAALIAVLPGFWETGRANAVAENQQAVNAPQSVAATAASSNYVGAETCATCHQDQVKGLAGNPHSKLALEHGGKGVTCEGCHGPGKAHVDSGGDATKIFRFTTATPKQVAERCLTCHVGDHPNFERTAHGDALVGCTSCHSIHKAEAQTALLKESQPALCYQCHTDIKAAFAEPFHHRVNEGLIKCSDCHDPHGTFQPQMLQHERDAGRDLHQVPHRHGGAMGLRASAHQDRGLYHRAIFRMDRRILACLTRNNVNCLCLQCHRLP